jgi:hypothetical protein
MGRCRVRAAGWSLAYGCWSRFEEERRLLVPLCARVEVWHRGGCGWVSGVMGG